MFCGRIIFFLEVAGEPKITSCFGHARGETDHGQIFAFGRCVIAARHCLACRLGVVLQIRFSLRLPQGSTVPKPQRRQNAEHSENDQLFSQAHRALMGLGTQFLHRHIRHLSDSVRSQFRGPAQSLSHRIIFGPACTPLPDDKTGFPEERGSAAPPFQTRE